MSRTPVFRFWPCVFITVGDLTAARLDIPIVTKFIWATEEWAIIFFRSICLMVVKGVYMIAITLRV